MRGVLVIPNGFIYCFGLDSINFIILRLPSWNSNFLKNSFGARHRHLLCSSCEAYVDRSQSFMGFVTAWN